MYAFSKSPNIYGVDEFSIKESTDGMTDGKTYRENPNSDHSYISKIEIHRRAYSRIIRLATTIGHELSHAMDSYNGNWWSWVQRRDVNYARNMSEVTAYGWNKSILEPLPPYHSNQNDLYDRGAHQYFINLTK